MNSKGFECLYVEVENKNSKSIAVNLVYHPLNGNADKKVQNFVNLMFRFGMIPIINKFMIVSRQTASASYHHILYNVHCV